MKKLWISLCLVLVGQLASGQRSRPMDTPERLFIEGKELFSLKDYVGCMDKMQAYKLRSKDADLIQEAEYMEAYSAYEQGLPEAAELLETYWDRYPSSRHVDEVSFLIGSVYFGRGDYEEAITWFKESDIDVLSLEQQETYAFRLAYSLLQTGNLERARGYFARIEEIGIVYRDASTYYVAYIDYAMGKYDKALGEFTRLKDRSDYRESSLYYITQIYFIQGKYTRVVRAGKELLDAYPDSENNAEVYRLMGNSYYHLGDEDQAIQMLSRYVSVMDQPLRGDQYILGVCYYNAGNYNKAVKSLGWVVSEPDALTQSAYMYLGQCYLRLGDKNNARMAFEAAATSSYDDQVREAAAYNYALVIHETAFTGFGESVSIFEDFLNDFPDSKYADKVNDYLVEVYLTTRNYEAALTSINKIHHPSVKILEAKQNILFQMGTQAFTNRQLDEAVELFDRSISMGSYDVKARNDAYFWRGESYYRQEDYQKAISDYRSYLNNTRQRNTDMYALAHYNLGYSYFKLKDYGEALKHFRRYVNLEGDQQAASYADAYNRIGDCLFQNRQFAAAEESYSQAAQSRPSAGDYSVYQQGFLLGLQKDYEGKIRTMDRLIREFPESQYVDDALYEEGRAYVLLENNQSAASCFERLIREFPQSSLARKAGIQLGLLYYNDNQLKKSLSAYKKVISDYPGSEEAKVALQDLRTVYIDLNDIRSYADYVNTLGGNVHLEVGEQDSLTYIAAEKLFMRGDNEGARRSLINYLQTFPDGAFSSNAQYYLGSIAFANKDYAEALMRFDATIEDGNTKFLEESVARVAEIHYLGGDYAEALVSFRQLRAVAEKPENKQAALLGIMRCALRTRQQGEALQAADDLLKIQKLSPELEQEARYVRAKAYIDQGQVDKALADLKVISKDTRTAEGAEAKYLLAQVYYDKKDDKNAEAVLMNFIENGTPHSYWLARGFILLADIYIRQGDDFQARQYLTSLRSNYTENEEINAMIEDRLSKLTK